MFLFLVCIAVFFILTARFYYPKKSARAFDPGEPPRKAAEETTTAPQEDPAVELGSGVFWSPFAHPNPHVLIVGATGTGKSWLIRLLAEKLLKHGFSCVLIDFHSDLEVDGIETYRMALDSELGVNPLSLSLDPAGGGPDVQIFDVIDQLRNAFRPMGSLQLALVEDCLKATYEKFGIRQEDPATWQQTSMPHFGDFLSQLEARIAADPKDSRARGLRSKLALAFDFRIFSKPQVPYVFTNGSTGPKGLRLELSKLPAQLQFMAATTFLNQIFRSRQVNGPQPLSVFILVDESKLCIPEKKDGPSSALNRLATEGRKFGLGLVVSSQYVGHLPRDIVVNTFTKVILRTDKTEIAATARKFRVDETLLESLEQPGDALVNFAHSNEWKELKVGRRSIES